MEDKNKRLTLDKIDVLILKSGISAKTIDFLRSTLTVKSRNEAIFKKYLEDGCNVQHLEQIEFDELELDDYFESLVHVIRRNPKLFKFKMDEFDTDNGKKILSLVAPRALKRYRLTEEKVYMDIPWLKKERSVFLRITSGITNLVHLNATLLKETIDFARLLVALRNCHRVLEHLYLGKAHETGNPNENTLRAYFVSQCSLHGQYFVSDIVKEMAPWCVKMMYQSEDLRSRTSRMLLLEVGSLFDLLDEPRWKSYQTLSVHVRNRN